MSGLFFALPSYAAPVPLSCGPVDLCLITGGLSLPGCLLCASPFSPPEARLVSSSGTLFYPACLRLSTVTSPLLFLPRGAPSLHPCLRPLRPSLHPPCGLRTQRRSPGSAVSFLGNISPLVGLAFCKRNVNLRRLMPLRAGPFCNQELVGVVTLVPVSGLLLDLSYTL